MKEFEDATRGLIPPNNKKRMDITISFDVFKFMRIRNINVSALVNSFLEYFINHADEELIKKWSRRRRDG